VEGAQAQLTRRRGLVVLIVLIAIAAIVYTQWPREERIARTDSRELASGDVAYPKRALGAYEIQYAVQTKPRGSDEVVMDSEKILVRRPFEARSSNDDVLAFAKASFGDEVVAVAPDVPDVDLRPDAVLREAARAGYADERELRRVAQRDCRVYRVSGIDAFRRLPKSPISYLDICVDAAGLVLEKLTFSDSEIKDRRVAVGVEDFPVIDEGAFDLEDPSIDVSVSGSSVQELEPDSRLPGGPFWDLDEPMEGFDNRGRYAVIESDPRNRTDRRTSVTDVWTKGPDVVFIERLSPGRNGKALPDDGPDGRRVDAGEIGTGAVVYGLRTSEVRVPTERGRVVRVRGTLAPSRLLEIAHSLKPLPEGPLVRLKAG